MAFGSMFPGGGAPQLQPMAVPAMSPDDNAGMGMRILQAALQRQGQGQGAPQDGQLPVPAWRTEPGQETGAAAPSTPMSIAPPAPNAGMGMLSRLFNRLGATGVQNQGGAGPAPTALTGLW